MTDPILNTLGIKTSHYILGAVSLVSALSWNEAVKKIINRYVPNSFGQTSAAVIYALVITLMLVLLIHLLPNTESELPIHVKEKLKSVKK